MGQEPHSRAQPQQQRWPDEQKEIFSLSFCSTLVINNIEFVSLDQPGRVAQQDLQWSCLHIAFLSCELLKLQCKLFCFCSRFAIAIEWFPRLNKNPGINHAVPAPLNWCN